MFLQSMTLPFTRTLILTFTDLTESVAMLMVTVELSPSMTSRGHRSTERDLLLYTILNNSRIWLEKIENKEDKNFDEKDFVEFEM